MKTKILLMHDDLHLSSVKQIMQILCEMKDCYSFHALFPGKGPLVKKLETDEIKITLRKIRKKESFLFYIWNVFAFMWFLRVHHFGIVHILDCKWEKRAELWAIRLTGLPILVFIDDYKEEDAVNSFLKFSKIIVASSQDVKDKLPETLKTKCHLLNMWKTIYEDLLY